ncbi:PleD family two-component response regulator [Desulfobotulus alkaliphilus]|uniref:histidine kinase n=1 Tax=Desulfobotulus alkaliphilus TaxID=622671 RepID=A0A562RVK3_9BACT|nr:response regulator [Desulfobotulus alkaliphilus]TWI73082.1 PleD family two-component response regulator [Desulfobotulus alkaliphilus]
MTQPGDILIVDDNTDNLRVLTAILKTKGYEARPVSSGPMALKAIAARPPCLILMDIMMPEMDGFEACRRIRSDPANQEIPLIFITALDALEDKLKAFGAGAVDYITKPFHEAEVLARIHTHLSLARARKKLKKNEALNRQLFKAEGLVRMAGAIAHKFNNHLHSVLGNLELAAVYSKGNPKALHTIESAMTSVEKASHFSRMILTYTGKTQNNHLKMELNKCCRRFITEFKSTMAENIRMETSLLPHPLTIAGDCNGIQQILNELFINACEAMDNKGTLSISTAMNSGPDIPEKNRFPLDYIPEKKDYARMEIRDTGKGISEKNLENIFDPFFSTHTMGRGIGLSAVLGMVRAHRGFIRMESTPGQGSTFTLYFPLQNNT